LAALTWNKIEFDNSNQRPEKSQKGQTQP